MFAKVSRIRIPQTTGSPVILQGLRRVTLPKPLSTKLNTKWNGFTNIIHNQLTFQIISLKQFSTVNNTTTAKAQFQQAASNPTPPPFDPASIQPKSSTTLKEVIQEQPGLLTDTVPKISTERNLDALIQSLEKNINPITDAPSTIAGGNGFFSPIGWGMDFVNLIHTTTGFLIILLCSNMKRLPWWLTIVASTLALRTVLLPIMIESTKHIARVNRISPVVSDLMTKSRAAAAAGKHLVARQYHMELMETYRKNNANPMKNILWALIQIPPTVILFFAMREMSLTFESFHEGGISFFRDLAVEDPYKRLNILSAATFVLGFELNARDMPPSWIKKAMRVGFICLAVFVVIWTQHFPQCVHLYWLVNSLTTITVQQTLKKVKPIRRFLGIPDLLPTAPMPGFLDSIKSAAEPPKQLFLTNKPKPTPGTSPISRKKEQVQPQQGTTTATEEKK